MGQKEFDKTREEVEKRIDDLEPLGFPEEKRKEYILSGQYYMRRKQLLLNIRIACADHL
ncbi:MAG: hypothetical protein ABIG37_00355 [Nanoarchaeota archaeon]|nr:hypothetical protein [Nanoarchaeota archaeon]